MRTIQTITYNEGRQIFAKAFSLEHILLGNIKMKVNCDAITIQNEELLIQIAEGDNGLLISCTKATGAGYKAAFFNAPALFEYLGTLSITVKKSSTIRQLSNSKLQAPGALN